MKSIALVIVSSLVAVAAHAQAPQAAPVPPAPVDCSENRPAGSPCPEVVALKLQLAQKNAIIARNNLDQAQAAWNTNLKILTDLGQTVIAENNWDKGTQFNPQTLVFTPAPPPPPPAPAKPEKKPEATAPPKKPS